MQLFAPSLIGATGVKDISLLPLSEIYLRIRALAQPAVLVIMVAQAGLLAQQVRGDGHALSWPVHTASLCIFGLIEGSSTSG